MPEDTLPLSRPQRRLLKRIYNARTVPILADGQAFLTYREASRYLLSLAGEGRDAAYAQMRAGAAEAGDHEDGDHEAGSSGRPDGDMPTA